MTTDEKRIFRIDPVDVGQVQHRLEVLNRRAERLGFEPIEISIGPLNEVEEKSNNAWELYPTIHRWHDVEILTSHVPRVEGYALAATIDFENGAVIINGNPVYGKDLPIEFRSTDNRCDHCGYDRDRHSVVVLEKEGEFIQVGRSCVKDFIGHDPHQIFSFHSLVGRIVEDMDEMSRTRGSRSEEVLPTKVVIAVALAVVAEYGYMSHRKSEETDFEVPSTATRVKELFVRETEYARAKEKAEWWKAHVTEDVREQALKVIEWVQEQEPSTEYMHNLIQLTAMEGVTWKRVGLIASSVLAYQRALDLLKTREALPESDYVGEVGKRDEFEVTFQKLVLNEGFYGTTYIHMFRDTDGNDLTWFGSKRLDPELAPSGSDVITIKGTVTKHQTYNDRKQTVINRVTLVS